VRIVEDRELFAAQCLEYDICAQGDSPIKALEVWRITAMGQVALDKQRGREPFAAFPCAPISLWCGIERDDLIGIYLDEITKVEPVENHKIGE